MVVEGDQAQMVAFEEASVSSEALGFRSCQEFEGDAGVDVASVGSVGETSRGSLSPLAAEARTKDAAGMAMVEVQLTMHMVCSTLIAASG